MKKRGFMRITAGVFANGAIAGAICLFVFASLIDFTESIFGAVIIQLLMLFIYMGMCYLKAWEAGDRDRNLFSFGHIQKDVMRGFKIGFAASVPGYVLCAAALISKLTGLWDEYLWVYKMLTPQFTIINRILLPLPAVSGNSLQSVLASFLLPLAMVIACGAGYILGFKNISLSERIVYKRDNPPSAVPRHKEEDGMPPGHLKP